MEPVTTIQTIPLKPNITDMSLKAKNYALHKYYQDNKAAILKDWDTLGKEQTRKRWGISTGGWNSIGHYFKPEVYGPKPKKVKKVVETTPLPALESPKLPSTGLPTFPPWDTIKGEPESVKLRWLDTYKELAVKHNSNYTL